jgi:hypothetical protein
MALSFADLTYCQSTKHLVQKGPWSAAQAVYEFMKQFKSKTGTDWKNRQSMQPKKGTRFNLGT